ncbi:hypothetical protein JCM15519_34150 [Fundidesulfovibrio butyratiphilus]
MRIKGQGASSGGFGQSSRDNSRRRENFRRSHRAGQRVRGRILEWRGQDLAWVEIDGHGLLAQVARNSTLGLERRFLIVSLEPEIVLRELTMQEGRFDIHV